MKLKFLVLSIFVLALVACKTQQTKSINQGFVSLFNGKKWDGFYLKIRNSDADLANKVFQIEDDMVHVFKTVPEGSEEGNGKNPTHGLFYTNK